jgi:hypothetical protein
MTRPRAITFLAVALVAAAGALWLTSAIRRAPETYPWGDAATTSIYAIRAARGDLSVGAYSRFRWNHPGPLLYELLAPLYALSGYREVSLKWTMLGLNLAALVGLLVVVRTRAPALGLTVPLALVPLINREQRLFFWAWNPVAPVLPFALAIGLAAAVAAGSVNLLPLLCAVISFIVQSHVGFVPPVALVCVTMLLLLAWQMRSRRITATPRRLAWSCAVSVAVVLVLWAVPLRAELRDGNLKAIAEFFLTPRPEARSLRTVFVIFANEFIGPLARGWEVTTNSASEVISWPVLFLAAVQLPLLLVVSVRAFRRGQVYDGAFAALTLAAAISGVFAIRSIVGNVADYLIIWIAIVGALSVASIAAESLQAVGAYDGRSKLRPHTRWVLATYVVAVAVVSGVRLTAKQDSEAHSITTRRLAEELTVYCRATGLDRPLLRFSDAGSDAAAGVLLQFYKQGRPIAVPDEWLFLVGDPFKSNGRETSEFYVMDEGEKTLPDGVTSHEWLATHGSQRLIRLFR